MSALEANRTRRDGGNDVNDSIRTLGACAYTRFYECQDPLPACRLGALQWSVRSLGCGYETALQSRRCSSQMAPPYTEVRAWSQFCRGRPERRGRATRREAGRGLGAVVRER